MSGVLTCAAHRTKQETGRVGTQVCAGTICAKFENVTSASTTHWAPRKASANFSNFGFKMERLCHLLKLRDASRHDDLLRLAVPGNCRGLKVQGFLAVANNCFHHDIHAPGYAAASGQARDPAPTYEACYPNTRHKPPKKGPLV